MIKVKRIVAVVCILIAAAGMGVAKELSLPEHSGFINDYAGILDPAAKQKLDGLVKTLEQKTSAELALAIVNTTEPLDPKTYAVKLFEKWKIGKKGKDNGILILMAVADRRIEIEVGYGLEGVIPDSTAGKILDQFVIPYFKQGNFSQGLFNGATAIAEIIAAEAKQQLGDEYKASSPNQGIPDWVFVAAFLGGMFLFIGLFVWLAVKFGGEGGGGGAGGSGSSSGSDSFSSSSSSDSSSSSSDFGGGDSGGGGAGRSW